MRALGIAAVLVVGGAAWWFTQSTPIALVSPAVDIAHWQTYTTAVQSAAKDTPAEAAVLKAWAAFNHAEVHAGQDPQKNPAFQIAAQTRFQALWHYVEYRTPEAYIHLGRSQGLALIKRLPAFLDWCRVHQVTPTEAIALPDLAPPVQAYIDVGGGLIRFAVDAGLVVDGALPADRLPFLQAVFMHNWIAPIQPRMPIGGFLSAQERVWFLRWKVEFQGKGPLKSRLAAADELTHEAGYPGHLNAGVLLWQAGQKAEANTRFQRSKHPLAKDYLRTAAP